MLTAIVSLAAASGGVSADPPERVLDCTSLGEAVVRPDGDIVALGSDRDSVPGSGCLSYAQYLPADFSFLIELKADGTLDPTFANGGIAKIGEGVFHMMTADQGSMILVSPTSLEKVGPDGLPSRSFGFEGWVTNVTTVLGGREIRGAAVQADGKIVVAGGSFPNSVTVARYLPDGELDTSFGAGGVSTVASPTDQTLFNGLGQVGIDGDGRILVVGENGFGAAALRLLPDGTPDPAFGADNTGFSAPWDIDDNVGGSVIAVTELALDPDGSFRAYGPSQLSLYWWTDNVFSFDESGLADGEAKSTSSFGGSGVYAETADGGLVTTRSPSRFGEARFNVAKYFPQTGSGGFNPVYFNPSPGSSGATAITYSPQDDSLIVTGGADAEICSPDCVSRRYGVIVKVDANTGAPDPGFGVGGTAEFPANECRYGTANPPRATASPWNRCRLKPQAIRAEVRFTHARGRRPGIRGTVNLRDPQPKPELQRQALRVKLPRRIRVRHHVARSKLYAKVVGAPRTEQEASIQGRTIKVVYRPDSSGYDRNQPGRYPPANESLEIRFGLKRGALKPASRRLRHAKLRFRVTGIASPSGEDRDYYGFGTRTKVVRTRMIRGR